MNTIDDISFLTKLKKPPKKLYYKGNLELLNMPKVSIVGSRKMSVYTKNLVLSLSSALAKRGVCVVSGAAIGVDITAHNAAYPNTIAVFGNGLDIIYPASNAKIISQIYQNSLALSEYEPDTPAMGFRFLERNRIVVGLSQALVVAQADFRSGSLQSARLAREMGVPVYVLPQRINESMGTNELLGKNLANLIYDVDEFAKNFSQINQASQINEDDEVVKFIKENDSFDEVYANFGDLIYEYELDGKVEILGTKVVIK
ncbi:DNA-processing protein DprA [Campylobacter geochelonis]|uniref:DNA-processing protein DprA n=1 Tax=Campylobacter geochelonis TaxID=1780362 RepID=UPI000770A798|nr:DNA-processing protein DprA [Campylobacter geochelonis]CZE50172.1 SMF family protein [Campylobacter geochelonis]